MDNSDRRNCYRAALAQLPEEERIEILEMANSIVMKLKARNWRTQVSLDNALEILAQVGMVLNKKGINND